MGLWILQTPSAVEHGEYINCTVYIDTETESIDLPCGEVPKNAAAIHWSTFTYFWESILIFYPLAPNGTILFSKDFNADNYGINQSSLVVKNIELSKTSLFRCRATGYQRDYIYTTRLQVVGKYSAQLHQTVSLLST